MKIKQWLALLNEQQDRLKLGLRNTRLHRLFGERIFSHSIWGFEKEALAGGFSLGLFIAFTPTIPFHMIFCVLGAIFFRVNLFAALTACWVTNPLTAPPVYLAAHWIGRFLLGQSEFLKTIISLFGFGEKMGRLVEHTAYLWAGSLLFAIVAAIIGNLLVKKGWDLLHRIKGEKQEAEDKAD